MFYNLQNHPTFHSEQRVVNLERRRECFVGLSVLLDSDIGPVGGVVLHDSQVENRIFCRLLILRIKNKKHKTSSTKEASKKVPTRS